MTGPIRLILTLHNHQPVGNFDGVFEAAYRDSYAPFLDLLDEFPEIPVVIHNSGCLLEWLTAHHPEYIDRLRTCVARGQVEILGGPFFEPILAAIPRRDRIGQITSYRHHLEQMFETRVRGAWIPERVWEQGFAGDLIDSGMQYLLLDDSHFRSAGLGEEELNGYYLTEDSGRPLRLFAGSERLRYLIPYSDPEAIINHCRHIATHFPNAILTFGDDGEKFGVWPGSKQHVYGDGWLRRFFTALRDNLSWLKVTTMAESIYSVPPLGRQYLPDASYREMTEWALPTTRQMQYQATVRSHENQHDWFQLKPFVRAGNWRNFLVKYPEVNEMYMRMLQVSQRLAEMSETHADDGGIELLRHARADLYRAQCNCPYWHGAFGGLYLPHLRNAVYKHLIAADKTLDELAGLSGRWVSIHAADLNCDARKEVCLNGDQMTAFLSPASGGHLYELDLKAIQHNLLATLARRPEPYHDRIRQCAGQGIGGEGGGVDPNGKVVFKQANLDQKLVYDHHARKSLVDHMLQPGLSREAFMHGQGSVGDFANGSFQTMLHKSDSRVEAVMSRVGHIGPYEVRIRKTVALDTSSPGELHVRYELDDLPEGLPIHFGVEFNFAGMPGGAGDRYFYDSRGRQFGTLESQHSLETTPRVGLVDEWLGLDVCLETGIPAQFWTFPIETVSQSESGFELVHQSTVVIPHWDFLAPAGGNWSVDLTLSIDTSAAYARLLGTTPTEAEVLPLLVV